jgi:hypothetical protein
MALLAGFLLTPLAGLAAAFTVVAHAFHDAPYDPAKYVTAYGLAENAVHQHPGTDNAGRHSFDDADDYDQHSDHIDDHDDHDDYDDHGDYDDDYDDNPGVGVGAGRRRTIALHTAAGTRAGGRENSENGQKHGGGCAPPLTQAGWPVGRHHTTEPRVKRRVRAPPSLLCGFGASNVVGSSRRDPGVRARMRTENFFKVKEYGGLFTDPQGNTFREFHNRTDFQPDREYLPNQAIRHNYTPLPIQPGTLAEGDEPMTNAMPRPDHTINNLADCVQNRIRAHAKFQVQQVTDGLTPDGNGPQQNQQAPAGFIGGYDTSMFDSSINMGTTVDAQATQRAAHPSDFAEQRLNKPGVATISPLEVGNRSPDAHADSATDVASFRDQQAARYHTVGVLDVGARAGAPETSTEPAWRTYSEPMQRDPTHSALRLTPSYDAMAPETAGQKAQTHVAGDVMVMENRREHAVAAAAARNAYATGAVAGQQTVLTGAGASRFRDAHAIAGVSGVNNDLGMARALLADTLETTQRTNVPHTVAGATMGSRLTGVGNVAAGDNAQRAVVASNMPVSWDMGTQLVGVNNAQTGDHLTRWVTADHGYSLATLGTIGQAEDSRRYS